MRGVKKMSKSRFTSIPYGYRLDGDTLAVDTDRAAIITEIFKSKASGMSLQQIAGALNERGVKTVRGGGFTKQGIKYILENRVYTGEYLCNGTVTKIPKIVSKQLFNKINIVKAPEHDGDTAYFGFIFDPAFALNGR
jgi:hypothetical protein